nr:uncharacterized protein I303_03178 [Kwoniella dejecticola CBS 10117]OBR87154.1 hypothetical protein I303_03178 [Kwoniella dejecticola CBS 10117]
MRMKCERPSRGQNETEICERCTLDHAECITKKRRVGRQPGVKNRKTREMKEKAQGPYFGSRESHLARDQADLPNPLQVLASEAVRRQSTPESDDAMSTPPQPIPSAPRDSESILDRYSEWTNKVHGMTGRGYLTKRIDKLLSGENPKPSTEREEPSVFSGRTDMARPDAAPEHDVITLQMLPLSEAQRLFDSFMKHLTNGSMYFDPKIHSLPFIRSRSSFLLATILTVASGYKALCSSSVLHAQLSIHTNRLVSWIRDHNLKSIEIVQGLLLLASWIEIPHTLSRDKTWAYVSYATALAVELRLDSPLPFCVSTDPIYSPEIHDLLVRNAHRVCLLLYIHDRNMAMVAGRYPIFPESTVSSQVNLDKWGKHERAYIYDGPICASVSLRKIITETHHRLAVSNAVGFRTNMNLIEQAMSDWRTKWAMEITSTLEYDIIARFSTFVLALTLLKKDHEDDQDDIEARKACETLAFEVCCASINSYKSWSGILNSATFDTSMVAFCAIYTLQSINRSDAIYLSDWSVFRLATIQELISELEIQARVRHDVDTENSMSVVDAMARQLSRGVNLILIKKQVGQGLRSIPSVEASNNSCVYDYGEPLYPTQSANVFALESNHDNPVDAQSHEQLAPQPQAHVSQNQLVPHPQETLQQQHSQQQAFPMQETGMDDLTQLLFSNNAIPFIPEWNLESLLPDATFNWDHQLNFSGQASNGNDDQHNNINQNAIPFFGFD